MTGKLPLGVRVAFWFVAGWLVAHEAHLLLAPDWRVGPLFDKGVHDVALLAGAALCLARAVQVRSERLAWGLIGSGLLAWSVGEVYFTLVLWDLDSPPVPSPADVGYLAMIPLLFSGLIVLLRARVPHTPRTVWVDGVTAGLAVASVSAAVVFEAVLGTVGGRPLSVATNLAYPLGDLVLLGLVAAALAFNDWRPDRTWLLLAVGIVLFCVADSNYLVTTASGSYRSPDPLDVGWWAGILLMGRAAWHPAASPAGGSRRTRRRTVAMPLLFALVGLGVLVAATVHHVNVLAVGLATSSIVAVMVRLAMTFRENTAMLEASREEALCDALTGLGNRRALVRDLEEVLVGAHDGAPIVLALFDLDGFKHYNDSFGHPAGDALLARIGRNLEVALSRRGRAYRMGGDEFCALIEPGAEVAQPVVEAAASALSEQGEGFSIRCSFGSVVLPREAASAESALRIADQRMYAHKESGRTSATRQTRDVILRALAERNSALGQHLSGVGDLAEAVAGKLGLSSEEVEQIRYAAELHDVGKVAIPDAILEKPSPLDASEWEFMRSHTLVGERIVSAAQELGRVGTLVRSSHEHFDGNGYPDRLAGSDIPLGARIVAVCDAFDAMITDRPYRTAVAPRAALQELRRCAGTQFDPVVVEAFAVAWSERTGAGMAAATTAAPTG